MFENISLIQKSSIKFIFLFQLLRDERLVDYYHYDCLPPILQREDKRTDYNNLYFPYMWWICNDACKHYHSDLNEIPSH